LILYENQFSMKKKIIFRLVSYDGINP